MKTLLQAATLGALAVCYSTASNAQDTDLGAVIFTQYCATCHGVDGAGAGPLTELMTTAVPDLTQLSARNDGEFPMLNVIHIVDGRTGLRAHGGPMPTYGSIFMDESQDDGIGLYGSVLETRGRVMSIALYLESIQS